MQPFMVSKKFKFGKFGLYLLGGYQLEKRVFQSGCAGSNIHFRAIFRYSYVFTIFRFFGESEGVLEVVQVASANRFVDRFGGFLFIWKEY